jgi:DNA-binding transcriptional LysR family regulator
LADATWLLREVGSGTREIINQALIPHLHQLRSGIEFGNSEAIKRAAAEGLGITCLSRYVVADMLHAGSLVELRTELPRMTRHLHLLIHRKKKATGGLHRLIEHLLASRA